jgi:glycosyltransferase involved in cell wall biosynthesis
MFLNPRVSIVIPTVGRNSLFRAMNSVRNQTYKDVEVILVGLVPSLDVSAFPFPIQLIKFPEVIGVGLARQIGTEAAKGEIVAYLDDDDSWKSTKLELQLREFDKYKSPMILYTRAEVIRDSRVFNWPRKVKNIDETLIQYLFDKSIYLPGRRWLPTPSAIVSKRVALSIGWDPTLKIHEDWDFALRAESQGVSIQQMKNSLIYVDQQQLNVNRISRISDWRESIKFLDKHTSSFSPHQAKNFLLGVTFHTFLSNGDDSDFSDFINSSSIIEIDRHDLVVMCIKHFYKNRKMDVFRKVLNTF